MDNSKFLKLFCKLKSLYSRALVCIKEHRLPHKIASVALFIKDIGSIKYLLSFYRSLCFGYSPLDAKQPWIVFKATDWLGTYLKEEMSVFEYGSGGSTLFFSKRVRKVVSVEHNPDWHKRVSDVLISDGILNCEYILCEPEKLNLDQHPLYSDTSYTSIAREGLSFEKYVKIIEKYPDATFDLIFIDGRARASCISHAVKKVRRGGYLMLDNSDRVIYHSAISLLSAYKRTDFLGVGPATTVLFQTSIWHII